MEYPRIRPLTYGDRKRLTAMLSKLVGDPSGNWLAGLISSAVAEAGDAPEKDTAQERAVRIALAVYQKLVDFVEGDMAEWLRSLVGKTPEEFEQLPIGIELDIITQIVESPEGADFFTRALDLYKKTQGFAIQFQGKSKK